jgi:uronate dehydrogenase
MSATTSTVLVTGAAGSLGDMLRSRLARPGRTLRLLDIAPMSASGAGEEIVTGSITDASMMADACVGVDAVVHLAGIATEGPWSTMLTVNVEGTRVVLDAARDAGVGRIVLASSNHAVGFQRRSGEPLAASAPARPDTYYGLAKVATEALGSLYADRFGMSVAALRIGTCVAQPRDTRTLSTWLSPDDLARLVEACLAAPPFGYRVVWGVSANTRRWWSLEEGQALGYQPIDDAESFAPELVTRLGEPDLADLEHDRVGGRFCALPLGDPTAV